MPEIRLPGALIAKVKDLDVAMITHVFVKAIHLVVAVTQIALLAVIIMEVIDPFDTDAGSKKDVAHIRRSL